MSHSGLGVKAAAAGGLGLEQGSQPLQARGLGVRAGAPSARRFCFFFFFLQK